MKFHDFDTWRALKIMLSRRLISIVDFYCKTSARIKIQAFYTLQKHTFQEELLKHDSKIKHNWTREISLYSHDPVATESPSGLIFEKSLKVFKYNGLGFELIDFDPSRAPTYIKFIRKKHFCTCNFYKKSFDSGPSE